MYRVFVNDVPNAPVQAGQAGALAAACLWIVNEVPNRRREGPPAALIVNDVPSRRGEVAT